MLDRILDHVSLHNENSMHWPREQQQSQSCSPSRAVYKQCLIAQSNEIIEGRGTHTFCLFHFVLFFWHEDSWRKWGN